MTGSDLYAQTAREAELSPDLLNDGWVPTNPEACWFCCQYVPEVGVVKLADRTIRVCHTCRRNPDCAVPGGEIARAADTVEEAALADLLALRESLAR